ncbi:MAG: hypothetical protein LBE82_06870 [Chitinophagaceae bacterium]|jgi:hypothetical protein|nr:hypothetical protein [Chitinophagaceae bacterium]
MDTIIESIHGTLPVLLTIAGIMIVVKLFLVFARKGINAEAFLYSFFRLYNTDERRMSIKQYKVYMMLNNFINIYLYAIALIFVFMLAMFGKSVLS